MSKDGPHVAKQIHEGEWRELEEVLESSKINFTERSANSIGLMHETTLFQSLTSADGDLYGSSVFFHL